MVIVRYTFNNNEVQSMHIVYINRMLFGEYFMTNYTLLASLHLYCTICIFFSIEYNIVTHTHVIIKSYTITTIH